MKKERLSFEAEYELEVYLFMMDSLRRYRQWYVYRFALRRHAILTYFRWIYVHWCVLVQQSTSHKLLGYA